MKTSPTREVQVLPIEAQTPVCSGLPKNWGWDIFFSKKELAWVAVTECVRAMGKDRISTPGPAIPWQPCAILYKIMGIQLDLMQLHSIAMVFE